MKQVKTMKHLRHLILSGILMFSVCVTFAALYIISDNEVRADEIAREISDMTYFSNMMRVLAEAAEREDLSSLHLGAAMLRYSGTADCFPANEKERIMLFLSDVSVAEATISRTYASEARRWASVAMDRIYGASYESLLIRRTDERKKDPRWASAEADEARVPRAFSPESVRDVLSGGMGREVCANLYAASVGENGREFALLPEACGLTESFVHAAPDTDGLPDVTEWNKKARTLWYEDDTTAFYLLGEEGDAAIIGIDKRTGSLCYYSNKKISEQS